MRSVAENRDGVSLGSLLRLRGGLLTILQSLEMMLKGFSEFLAA